MRQYEIWLADLDPRSGTEPRKVRPVLIVQSDLLNTHHNSTIVCPLTTSLKKDTLPLRIFLASLISGQKQDSDILLDQIRSIDNRRFIKKIGALPIHLIPTIQKTSRISLI